MIQATQPQHYWVTTFMKFSFVNWKFLEITFRMTLVIFLRFCYLEVNDMINLVIWVFVDWEQTYCSKLHFSYLSIVLSLGMQHLLTNFTLCYLHIKMCCRWYKNVLQMILIWHGIQNAYRMNLVPQQRLEYLSPK